MITQTETEYTLSNYTFRKRVQPRQASWNPLHRDQRTVPLLLGYGVAVTVNSRHVRQRGRNSSVRRQAPRSSPAVLLHGVGGVAGVVALPGAAVAVDGLGEVEELGESPAVHVEGGDGDDGGAEERRHGEVERVGIHGR